MARIIPVDLLEPLESLLKGAGIELPSKPTPPLLSSPQEELSIDALVNVDPKKGVFFSDKKDKKGNYIGVAVALEKALKAMDGEGVIASLPYLVAGKAHADKKKNYLWQDWFTALSEEHAGIDKEGRLGKKGEAVVVTVHGCGLLSPKRIFEAYDEGLTPQFAVKLKPEEFDELLQGNLPSGEKITLYPVEDVGKGKIPQPFGKYAIFTELDSAKVSTSGQLQKKQFMNNPLVLARAGILEYLEAYFEKAKSDGKVGNYHRLAEIDASQPQGRVLFVNGSYGGLDGNDYLSNLGRFVWVSAGGAARAKRGVV